MKEEDDPVVQEIPVFMSKALAGQLYLLQFQQTPMTIPVLSDDPPVIQARIKPNQDKLQVKLEVDTEVRYCKRKGKSFQSATVGKSVRVDENDDNEHTLLKERILESMPIPVKSKSQRYVIGVIRNGELHLSPLKSIVQMQNKMSYLNSADAIAKLSKDMEDDEDESDVDATKVTVRFKQTRIGGDQGGAVSRSSKNYKALMMKQDEEPWTDLDYFNRNDNEQFDKLFSVSKECEAPLYVVDQNMYLRSLFPKQEEDFSEGIGKISEQDQAMRTSHEQMKFLPLTEQLKILMLKGKLMQFGEIREFLRSKLKVSSIDEQMLVRSLQTVAVMVQGCWVVKSDLLFSANFVSGANGISGPVLQKARDLILSHFEEGARLVTRADMCKLTHLPASEATEIIQGLCHVIPKYGWAFALPYDESFINANPEVAERQAMTWQAKRNRTMEERKSRTSIDEQDGLPRQRRRSRTVSNSQSDD